MAPLCDQLNHDIYRFSEINNRQCDKEETLNKDARQAPAFLDAPGIERGVHTNVSPARPRSWVEIGG